MKRKQVRSACLNCRVKHARCDNERPCEGCVKAGIADSCDDAPRKHRRADETEQIASETSTDANYSGPEVSPSFSLWSEF